MSRKTPTLNLVSHDYSTGITSYAWRLWWHGSSFYLVPRWAPLSGAKVSLHGPDESHSTSGFKVGIDSGAMGRAELAGGTAYIPDRALWFPGREVQPGVTHVVTLRWTPGLFRKGRPSGPNPGELPVGSMEHVVPAPAKTYASDVDIYVCEGKPWWRDEEQARKDNACIGPLRNDADQFLTAVSVRRRLSVKPTPNNARLASPLSESDRMRAVGGGLDDDVLWLVEQWTSCKRIQQHSAAMKSAAELGDSGHMTLPTSRGADYRATSEVVFRQ